MSTLAHKQGGFLVNHEAASLKKTKLHLFSGFGEGGAVSTYRPATVYDPKHRILT